MPASTNKVYAGDAFATVSQPRSRSITETVEAGAYVPPVANETFSERIDRAGKDAKLTIGATRSISTGSASAASSSGDFTL